jgi:hypothetical protein
VIGLMPESVELKRFRNHHAISTLQTRKDANEARFPP